MAGPSRTVGTPGWGIAPPIHPSMLRDPGSLPVTSQLTMSLRNQEPLGPETTASQLDKSKRRWVGWGPDFQPSTEAQSVVACPGPA